MTIRKHVNNFGTTLNGAITNVATSLTLTSVAGLPSIGSGETFRLTLVDGAAIEIVEVTDDASSPTFTVTRGMEGTSAQAWSNGATVRMYATANSYDRKQDQVATAGEVIDFGSADSFEIPNSTAPTVNANGEIAVDTSITDFSHGLIKYYSGEECAVVAVPVGELTTPSNGDVVTYNSTADEFQLTQPTVSDGDKGDITVASSGTVWTIDTPTSATVATDDKVLIKDTSASDVMKYVTTQSIRDLVPGSGTITSAQLATALTDETGSGAAVFSTSPTLTTPTLGVASATSINFGQDALNYYDEGTFTPTVTAATVGDLSVSYAEQSGVYTRVGNLINIECRLDFTATYTTASGQLRVAGLPFSPSATTYSGFNLSSQSSNFNWPASRTMLVPGTVSGATYIVFRAFGDAVGVSVINITDHASGANVVFQFAGSYLI